MSIKSILVNSQFKKFLELHGKIDEKVKHGAPSLLDEPELINLKKEVSIASYSGESLLQALFPILIIFSYIILVVVFYGFYFDSDVTGFQRSANIFIISSTSALTLYAYKGHLLALKTLNVLNTLGIVFAIFIFMLDYFVYYMHHEWHLLIIVVFNFFTNRVIINSHHFSHSMKENLWYKINNDLLQNKINKSIEKKEIESDVNNKKRSVLKIIWQYCMLNENIRKTFQEINVLNQRVKNNDKNLLNDNKLSKYNGLLLFSINKKVLIKTVLSMILLVKAYVMTAFILLSSLDNKNDLPILFFIIALVLIFSSFSVLLTHKGVVFGFKMLISTHYLFFVLFLLLLGLKFIVGIIEYRNISLYIIVIDFLLAFFMLNTRNYNYSLRELHYFLAWHRMIMKL
ncbi:hypothetical protein [Xenorhabdus sp. KJ12.1]|uniref:hypothetical protein n=1 Tax=Xenorhabdus sp. KJ12.1 TaxID=1851571 RepID=UPI000C03BA5B|nr:hypothetical protein [Xenorhabdus sp. KJ12.1]PHM70825.1 hypothetical protein Xekj_01634 [Xenorhabdus sp. KJ12.1]